MTNIDIAKITVSDLYRISKIHTSAFPNSAMTQLGLDAVRRYYEWQFIGPHNSENLGAKIEDQLVGFCFGGVFHGSLSGFLHKNRSFLVWRIATHPYLLFNDLVRERILLAGKLFKRFSMPKSSITQKSTMEKSFGILAIAVDPSFQGRSVGRKLMEAEEFIARLQNFPKMHLSVAVNNMQAIQFYERIGWKKVFSQEGTWQGKMEKQLEEQ